MRNIRITRSVIPNLFTSLNMFSGFVSVIYSSEQDYIKAAMFIIIGAVFDALDGIMARLTHSSSEFGVELDSLSDLVSFGVAPAFLIYHSYLNHLGALGIVISSLLMVFGGLRLARFNVQLVGFDKSYFTGLPIPSSAITIAAYVLVYFNGNSYQEPFDTYIIPLVILLSLLMVSKIRYETLPKFSGKGIKERPYSFAFVVISLIIIIATEGKALFYVFILMILIGIFRHAFSLAFRTGKGHKVSPKETAGKN
ncbi:MAG: CDP-diacylglycerol--serine O-phosphatidyltransferase [Bacteroidota bacterium]|nr:CDP-diacylglycerol--serine O-phosphatidyltransferase [Ignavibacteria bacterium]MCU7498732.1 CDP-diacylglycerol--serine O-phosphatidyltransferase [Ignavibacteria bacterium]MCU7512073.1 CDP-diacylglycerol--serine O-phosphatidyltransferase [Ignavibacteria bacterium]MCU7520606.1 CDP-diacylglycerol--serine O-phosphatidyltransferase [Ignavibacteria bacterium]MCU7523504.1 CDP-diacylglycerol--serine O-phosphatidyltransferase [Ignavibacteria bacterium]